MAPTTAVSDAPERSVAVRPGYKGDTGSAGRVVTMIAWSTVLLFTIYYLYTEALPYLQPLSDKGAGARASARTTQFFPLLLAHIVAGTIALLLGPLQFWRSLRSRHLAVHRWIGRTYLLATLVGATASMYITVVYPNPAGPIFRSGIAGLGIVWLTTSFMAYSAIRQGNVPEHREWMIRSYTVTFAFVAFRVSFEGLRGTGLEYAEIAGISAWICWAGPLFAVEVARSIARQRRWNRNTPRLAARPAREPASIA